MIFNRTDEVARIGLRDHKKHIVALQDTVAVLEAKVEELADKVTQQECLDIRRVDQINLLGASVQSLERGLGRVEEMLDELKHLKPAYVALEQRVDGIDSLTAEHKKRLGVQRECILKMKNLLDEHHETLKQIRSYHGQMSEIGPKFYPDGFDPDGFHNPPAYLGEEEE